jgi:hypothetical protein
MYGQNHDGQSLDLVRILDIMQNIEQMSGGFASSLQMDFTTLTKNTFTLANRLNVLWRFNHKECKIAGGCSTIKEEFSPAVKLLG